MTTKYINAENNRLSYSETGSGPLAVCIPSMGDLRAEYRFIVPLLVEAGYHVVCMDVRGHGETGINWNDYSVAGIGSDIVTLIRSLNAGPAFIIGESMAAGAAVWAAAENPELVTALVLIGPFVRGEPTLQISLLFKTLFARPWGPFMWELYYKSLYPTSKPPDFNEYTAALRANLLQPGRMEALQQMLHASKSASEQRLSKVRAPALILMGGKDPDFKEPETEAGWVSTQLNGHYEMIQGAGHYPQAEMPGTTAQLIISFFQSLAGAPDSKNPLDIQRNSIGTNTLTTGSE